MRRNLYIGFGIFLLCLLASAASFQDLTLFVILLIVLLIIGIFDRFQKRHALLRNFPVLGHVRYIMEFFRPEIQQYFVADDQSERPFNRETRSMIYRRAKGLNDTTPFGTMRDVDASGYQWLLHSLAPKKAAERSLRLQVGGPLCTQPYLASRLNISAMSYGALSSNAIMALNEGAKIGNFAHNTGEGGLSQYHLQGGDLIWQIGTGYFGCRAQDGGFDPIEFQKEAVRPEVKMIEIKLSQGAKPSHGGILPAAKLTEEIAKIRKVPLGKDVLSPPAHSAFSTPLGFLAFIQQLRELSGGKPVGFKLCVGRQEEFMGIAKAMLATQLYPDFITVDGGEGGTGAAPVEYVDHIGTPLDEGLIFVRNVLVGIGVKDKIQIIASGKIDTGFDMIVNMILGADLCNSARAMMLALGCIQSLQCNQNTCPTGVATQNKRLERGLVVQDKKVHVANFHHRTLESFEDMLGSMGVFCPSELTPRMVKRRVDQQTVRSFDEIYTFLENGALLSGKVPVAYQKAWDLAQADRF